MSIAAGNIALLAGIWRRRRSGVLRGGGDGRQAVAPIEVSVGGLVDAWQVPDLARRLGQGALHLDEGPVGPRGDRDGMLRFLLAVTGSHIDPAAYGLPGGVLRLAVDEEDAVPLSPTLRHALSTGEARAEALVDRGVVSREQLVSLCALGILAEEGAPAEAPVERWGPPVSAELEIIDDDWDPGEWEDEENTVVEEVFIGGGHAEPVDDEPTDAGGGPAVVPARALPPWSTAPTFDPLAAPQLLELHDQLLEQAWTVLQAGQLADARSLLQQAAGVLPGQVRPALLATWVDLHLGATTPADARRVLRQAADEAEVDPIVSGLIEEIEVLLRA